MKQVVRELGLRLLGGEFSAARLASILKHDGGHDMSNLSLPQLETLVEGTFAGDWREPAFSCSELLTYYGACAGQVQPTHVVGWACAAILLAEAARRGATGWDRQFGFFLDSFLVMRAHLTEEEACQIFEQVYRP